MLSFSASRFDSMPAQPPTPPKEVSNAVEDAISFLDDSHEIERALTKSLIQRRPSLQAEVPSPVPSQDSAATSISKKVGFSPHAIFHQLPGQDLLPSPAHRVPRRSPSARTSKPLKSILKATHAPPLTPDDIDAKLSYFSPDVPGSFANMLQSVLNQLASQSVSNRLDAYMSLNGALQAYGDLPDPAALTQKLGLLSQFLARDIAWKNSDGKLNANIVIQALKLANFLLFNDSMPTAFDDDFRSFLVDRSITVMESSDIPKQIMKAHVHLLAQPKLSSPVMTAARADKILTALQSIDQRCSGNNIVSTRLVIYQRLLEQAPTLMLTRIRDWLEQTFHCMLSSISDIRGRAIDTCTKGGVRLGTQANAAKAVSDFLDTEIEEGQSYFEYFSTKMLETLAEKEVSSCVPRIWSAVVLYFRNRRRSLEKWTKFRSWLTVMQNCLNSSDILVRYEATIAWNRLVYTTMSDSSPSKARMKMLKMPIVSGIDRRGGDMFSKQIRQYTMDCYHNLLHYGLKPTLSTTELDDAWEALVDPVLTSMVKAVPKGRATACRILNGLLSGNGGVWNANAALATNPIKSEDLPRLEPRWVRSHLANVLKILQPAIRTSLWSDPASNLTLDSAWSALMQTIADAGAQEVKTSSDLKQAIALLVGLLRQLWNEKSQAPAEGNLRHWLNNYSSLIDTMVRIVGPGHFTEDFLATSEGDVIEVAPTPSMKRSKHHSAPQSPMVILLRPFFLGTAKGVEAEGDDQSAASTLVERFVSSRPSPLATLDLLNRSLFALRNTLSDSVDGFDETTLWKTFAHCTQETLKSCARADQRQSGGLGQGLRHSTDILNAGLAVAVDNKAMHSITVLYDAMYDLAKEGAGDGGIVIGVTEPVSKGLISAGPSLPLQVEIQLVSHMLSRAVWPRNRQSIEAARKALWGVGLAPHKATLFDPFDQVYAILVDVMTSIYAHFDDINAVEPETASQLLRGAVAFLEAAPISLLLTGLRRTQDGFAVWVQDEQKKTAMHSDATEQITATWTALLKLIKSIPSSNSNVLKALEALLVAGFASPHRQVVNDTILFWNNKFGAEDSLEYPDKLESVLRARLLDASIDLPTFPDSNADHVPATLPDFFETESQAVAAMPAQKRLPHPQGQQKEAVRNLQAAKSVYFTASKSPAAKATSIPNTIDRRSAASGSSTPRARLRHNDSQIQFAPIDSSPIQFEDESQHLTEHQKEVQARQSEEAQMYPGLSSSPMAQSTALPRSRLKRLDFSSEGLDHEEEGLGTPTALPDAAGLMSDDLPSSPTPSSTKDTSRANRDLDDDHVTEDELEEPPSSPPRSVDGDAARRYEAVVQVTAVGPDDTTVANVIDFGATNEDEGASLPTAEAIQVDVETELVKAVLKERDELVDLASDSVLPTEQLQLEAEAAETVSRIATSNSARGKEELDVPNHQDQDAEQLPERQGLESGAKDVTRVEDSFIGQPEDEATDQQDAPDSQGSRRSTRKRKRSNSVASTTKKQKSQSPFKRILSTFWPTSQQDDDDIGDDIVVASSQRSRSPDSPLVQQSTVSPSQRNEPSSEAVGEPTTDVSAVKQEAMGPPPKRGRGRPTKSATPTTSLNESSQGASQTRSLKRKSSVLSNAGDADTEASSSFVKDTPAPSKSRKGRNGQSASQPSDTSSPQQNSQTGRLTRRTATAVVVSPPGRDSEEVEAPLGVDGAGESIEVATPQKPAQAPKAAVQVDERPKLTPRSILGRLRNALSDFVGMKVSTSEAREFDDVLFEFRREVHEADRRGRSEGGQ